MKKININLMERYLLLLDRFVDKLTESGFEEQEIIEQSYLFCAGFYIKYQPEIEKLTFSNREVVLTFLLLSYYSHINKLDDNLINKERMKHVCSSLINFIVSNGSRTEKVYANEKKKYEASTLKRSLSIKEKKRKYGL
ncbi:hypothetical protein CB740_15640 [Salmonella enterica subsp. enterica serovar Enteritidis]|uniref:hypothetical protein n=1 Tax=Klebsiella variicola TaxID=244366 RepID=UPI000E2A81DB|nr:hypothetical protein [Klebsiella variicola]EBX9046160.1 hypothetical protein [Salmonella enterica subsp. enterica serovar Enteritidis]EHM9039519.1 hypothetical protein [Salmonella enterica]EBZ7243848.1 hypothetical protein [Salmonella enterica subsp. enterica serovar Enteritidis]ECA4064648.1 hypothetical protein [Salmonella enterica subsp. enterica serovar Enteritidis]ECB6079135.1 hypothetical protein [Salmonella enterica subsp. enterica serovar Enteritidis]